MWCCSKVFFKRSFLRFFPSISSNYTIATCCLGPPHSSFPDMSLLFLWSSVARDEKSTDVEYIKWHPRVFYPETTQNFYVQGGTKSNKDLYIIYQYLSFLGGLTPQFIKGMFISIFMSLELTSTVYEPWSILTIWLMVIPSIIRILIMVIINPYEPLDD